MSTFPSTLVCLHRSSLDAVRVLQYRSVAFVTYVHEGNAQFAKESMACQSLDNDEILNVRWATEDPNPTSKVAEKRRLEEIGREAIQARMDPRIMDAMRSMRALEDGVELELAEEDAMLEDDGRGAKRQRLIEDAQQDEEEEVSLPPEPQPEQQSGILSADALEGLKYFAEIRRRNGLGPAAPPPKVAAPPVTGGLGLGDYASDDED